MATGLWNTLELLAETHPPAAVMAEWRQLAGADFAALNRFLCPTQRLAQNYPCLAERDCGCRHEVETTELFSVCQCEFGGCEAVKLTPAEIIIHELDTPRFGDAVARSLGFGVVENGHAPRAATKIWPAGTCTVTRSPVLLAICPNESQLLENLQVFAGARTEPFILLAPTAGPRSEAVNALLQRQRCAFIPLGHHLAADGGKFTVTNPIQPILERFVAGLADVPSIAPVLEGIKREIKSVRDERRSLLSAKARLEEMQGEGLFGFVQKIDREARELFFAILAAGDAAKASRVLTMKDSTLRSKIAKWRKRGKAYAALAEFVRWRKSIRGQAGIDFAKRLASGAERETDYAALIRDIIEELEEFNSDNWEDKCDSLANLLRGATS